MTPRTVAAIPAYRFLPAIFMMTAIFLVSSQPGDTLHLPTYLNYDKAWHLLEYGILAATLLFALPPRRPNGSRITVALGVISFAFLYGLSDEFHQSFVPYRTSSFADIIADTLGAALVTSAWWWRLQLKAGRVRQS